MEFYVLELLGIAAGLIVATVLVRYGLPVERFHPAWRTAGLLAVYFIAIGPFVARCLRRGRRAR
jgi:hypothetical protein